MASIAQSPQIAIAELAEAMSMERTTLLRALKPLQSAGWVVTAAAHARAPMVLTLSKPGGLKLAEAAPLWRAAQIEYESGIGSGRAKRLRVDLGQATSGPSPTG